MICSKPINYKQLIDTRTSPRQSRTTFSADQHHSVIRHSTNDDIGNFNIEFNISSNDASNEDMFD